MIFNGTCSKCLQYEIKLRRLLRFPTPAQLEANIQAKLALRSEEYNLDVDEKEYYCLTWKNDAYWFPAAHTVDYNEETKQYENIDIEDHGNFKRTESLIPVDVALEEGWNNNMIASQYWSYGVWQGSIENQETMEAIRTWALDNMIFI